MDKWIRMTYALSAENFLFQPRQVVHANAAFSSTNRDENVLPLENGHLVEAPARDQLVDLALAAAVEQHESRVGADEQVDTPERSTENLAGELLLVLAYLGRVCVDLGAAGTPAGGRRGIDVHLHLNEAIRWA